ncbi:hypothetical protein BCR33DRAFT_719316 [Rhizoclosmatium globosum]|uniref:Uncharacterized protein n=1 Tax=Rhizoclosmatium globosum TaxID=329046 RepID=A0A1Y2C181_9FUNG|nr:hypothetical protein BCR33DRAFT_719316 [Rhizoclosmatium globosum]|eukprot:ORY40792.1 hypothetical protein BCR33DRAFT_719316 [Rhizoclosmatium globosum]
MVQSVQVSGLVLAQIKYDLLNSGGLSKGVLLGHSASITTNQTTDDAEDSTRTHSVLVLTGFAPLSHFDSTKSNDSNDSIVGIYSFRKGTRIDGKVVSLKEDALFEDLIESANQKDRVLMLFTLGFEGTTLNWDFVALSKKRPDQEYTRIPIQITNLIESTQSSHPVFLSSISNQPSTSHPFNTVLARLDPMRHVKEYESVLEDSMKILGKELAALEESEREVVELRRRVAEIRNGSTAAPPPSLL